MKTSTHTNTHVKSIASSQKKFRLRWRLCSGISVGLCLGMVACGQLTSSQPKKAHTPAEITSAANISSVEKAPSKERLLSRSTEISTAKMSPAAPHADVALSSIPPHQINPPVGDRYQRFNDNPVQLSSTQSVSTLSLDVDTGSYSLVRRLLKQGQLPPVDAVRVEEMVNYFQYKKTTPIAPHPFAMQTEVGQAPWNNAHYLLRVSVHAIDQKALEMPPANLVFLVDVSGSMNAPDKLPLVQASLKMLTQQLRDNDRVSLVVYAGRTAVELPSTSGREKNRIIAAIDKLSADGSTNGEAALKLAYAQAREGFIKGGINRILLATDGDFNVGLSDVAAIKDLVKQERESGISLTTLGFGQGNYHEALMEQIADVGNGNYSYIDSLTEARKVLIEEMSSTFNTVAHDAKIQLEFNPEAIAEWRLIGYENRLLREEDFKNDAVDAGEVGAGKSVTALYELTPVGQPTLHSPRRYSPPPKERRNLSATPAQDNELGFLRIRYKASRSSTSQEVKQPIMLPQQPISTDNMSNDFRFAAAVAAFGQLLRHSPYTVTFHYRDIKALARDAAHEDHTGYRQEFLGLVDLAATLTSTMPSPDQRADKID